MIDVDTDRDLCVVLARGGSKGVHKKNLRCIDGRPLVSYALNSAAEVAQQRSLDLVLSSDDSEILALAEQHHFVPLQRPKHLAQDLTPSFPAVMHAMEEMESRRKAKYRNILYLQSTAPLCKVSDIVAAFQCLEERGDFQSVVAVVEAETHPFRLKRLLADGTLLNFIEQGFEDMRPRQQLPPVFRRAGSIYLSRRQVLVDHHSLVGSPCFGMEVSRESAIDIDSEIDFELASVLIKKVKGNNREAEN